MTLIQKLKAIISIGSKGEYDSLEQGDCIETENGRYVCTGMGHGDMICCQCGRKATEKQISEGWPCPGCPQLMAYIKNTQREK